MLLYGICIEKITDINWQKVIELIKNDMPDIYDDMMLSFENPNEYDTLSDAEKDTFIKDWIAEYQSEECHGLGAILKDLIKEKEGIELDIDNPDNVYVGICATVPWYFNDSIKNMTNIEFVELINKYVTKFASQPYINWWKVDDDLDY